MNSTLVQLVLFAIFVAPICMICPLLLLPSANFHVLSLDQLDQDFLLARSRQNWLIARSVQRFSASPLNPSPTPTYSPVPGVKLQDAPCFVESHAPLAADPEILYRYSEEVLFGDTWFDFCQSVQPYLESDVQIQEPAKLPVHRQFSNAVQNLYWDVLALLKVQICRLAYLFYSQSSSTTHSKPSCEPKQKAHTRMREPKQIKTSPIVAHSESLLFWLFDVLVVCLGKRFPDAKLIRIIGNLLTWLWVVLIHGDLKVHACHPQHDLTHLHLGLGTSAEDEILAQICEPILFSQERFPNRLGSFQNRFIGVLQECNPQLDFVETFKIIRAAQPRIAQVHQRLSFILERSIDHTPLSGLTTAHCHH
jgi:hypothetical protein